MSFLPAEFVCAENTALENSTFTFAGKTPTQLESDGWTFFSSDDAYKYPQINNSVLEYGDTLHFGAGATFDDLENYGWVSVAIQVLSENGIISGTGGDKFEPAAMVTREQFVKMLVVMFDIYEPQAKTHFSDVPENSWCEPYIASAEKYGLVSGTGDGCFGCGLPVTREDMVVICCNFTDKLALNINPGGKKAAYSFADKDSFSGYAEEAIERMHDAGLISGVGNNMFNPKEHTTRAEAAKLIYGLYVLK